MATALNTSGSALELFTDFVRTTGPAFLRGPEDVVLEAVRNTYTLPRLWDGKSMGEIVQGGETIKDTLLFDEDSGYEHYKPNAEFTYRNPQVLVNYTVPWRFTKAEMVWTDQEVGLNTGQLNRGARHHKFKTLKRTKEQNLWAALCNGMETDMWERPDNAEMEATTGTRPYSIPAFITELGSSDNFRPIGFTTIQGINPANERKWRNEFQGYAEDPGIGWDLFPAFSRMWHSLRFDRLPKRPELSDPTTAPNFIATSLGGVTNYEDGLRQNQDTFVTTGRQDPAYAYPKYRGTDVVYIEELDHVGLYSDQAPFTGDATVNDRGEYDNSTERDGTALGDPGIQGPRYWWINGRYITMVIHNERYFYKKEPFSPSRQPFTKIMIVDLWHNLVLRARRRNGIVSPTSDVTAGQPPA